MTGALPTTALLLAFGLPTTALRLAFGVLLDSGLALVMILLFAVLPAPSMACINCLTMLGLAGAGFFTTGTRAAGLAADFFATALTACLSTAFLATGLAAILRSVATLLVFDF